MSEKRTRIITRIFALDRNYSTELTSWKENYDLEKFLEEEYRHFGLHLISDNNEIFVNIEYKNIIWEYKFLYGSYKKKYKFLTEKDERWAKIEKDVLDDLKIMGAEYLREEILKNLKNGNYYEFKNKINEQFKRYCV